MTGNIGHEAPKSRCNYIVLTTSNVICSLKVTLTLDQKKQDKSQPPPLEIHKYVTTLK